MQLNLMTKEEIIKTVLGIKTHGKCINGIRDFLVFTNSRHDQASLYTKTVKMANFFSVLFVIATVVFGLHTVTCQVVVSIYNI